MKFGSVTKSKICELRKRTIWLPSRTGIIVICDQNGFIKRSSQQRVSSSCNRFEQGTNWIDNVNALQSLNLKEL
ncbi:hypothetical protein CUMW_107640 [Citrus unshiu]|uniref:Uncharacterized protein n=1 Tax=Citrus unshiu TaxID=55188 RepID=A0A2H5P701_CITUN|nr:hypothetical protein CUMW_107640 [Citrus unshiu]